MGVELSPCLHPPQRSTPFTALAALFYAQGGAHFRLENRQRGDCTHPRWYAELSDATLYRISFIFFCMESLGLMPSNLWLMILLYRKQSGGYRPIGLLPSFIRLWECCRVAFLWEWEAANVRPYNYATPGCSSLQVIRTQGLYIEGAPKGCTQC